MDAQANEATPDPALRVRALIALTEELGAIIEQENSHLRARRPRDLSPLQADKARLAAAYAEAIREVACDRAAIGAAGEALLTKLREITREFETRAGEQRALLETAMETGEGVMRAIAAEVAANAAPSYGAGEKLPGDPGAGAAWGPLSVDERA